MEKIHFQPPAKDSMKNKMVTSFVMIAIIASLYLTCYYLFFRSVDVDITSDVTIVYSGESESATAEAENLKIDYNQRKQEFMDSIRYTVTPSENLKNGDTITITASYDMSLAKRYHINPVNSTRMIKVSGLPERINGIEDLNDDFLEELSNLGQAYLDKNIEMILNDDFTSFHIDSTPTLISSEKLHRVFLDANSNGQKDKIIDVYAITAKGYINTSSEKEKLEEKESTIYYLVVYNEINTSNTISNDNIYGEKLIVSDSLNLNDDSNFKKVIDKKYSRLYEITYMDMKETAK